MDQHDGLGAVVCPNCRTVLRDDAAGFVCGGCGYTLPAPDMVKPAYDDLPGIHGG